MWRTLLLAAGAVIVAVPAGLAAWIGGVLLAAHLGPSISANQVFAWLMSLFIGAVVWPLALWRTHVLFWRRQHKSRPPAARLSFEDAVVRTVVVIVGVAGIVAISGPQEVIATLSSVWGVLAPGRRASGALLQVVGLVLVAILMLPPIFVTDRALRRIPHGDPARVRLELRQNWYFAAASAWVVCLGLGLLAGWLVLTRL